MMQSKQANCVLLALLLWNPLMLLLLTKSWGITAIITMVMIAISFMVSISESLRVKVWAFNLCALSSIAFHSELLFREFLSDKDIPNLYELHGKYYFNKPFLDKEFRTNEYVSSYKTNCQGYRIDKLSNAYDSIKTCDWLFIGDSFTQGAQVNYKDLYTTQLFRNFSDKIIVNAGISGAGLYDELNYFKDKGKKLSPKVVFLQIGVFNDFFNIKERSATFQDYLMEKSDLYRYFAFNIVSTDSLPLGRWTEPFFPSKKENIDYNILFKEKSEIKIADMKAFKTCINAWKKEVESIGAKLVLFFIPSKEQVSPTLLKEVMDKYSITSAQLDMTAPNRLFENVSNELNLIHYDLTKGFCRSEDFPFFNQDEHLSISGHTIIATELTKRLQNYLSATNLLSVKNSHDRYPSFHGDNLLYQSQDIDGGYLICNQCLDGTNQQIIVKSYEELVHPIISQDGRYLAYTEGNQESSETDVTVRDIVLKTEHRVNGNKQYAAIPMFNHQGTMLALPIWNRNKANPANIAIYSLERNCIIKTIPSKVECWRPIFTNDDKKVLYIQKEKFFKIKSFDLATGAISEILSLPFDIWDIALSPSGRYIVFAGNKDGNWDLFSYCLKTKQVRQLTKTKGNEWDPAFGKSDSDLFYAGTFGFNDGIFYKKIEL